MTWQAINVPDDTHHWINPDVANGWLQHVLDLSNPNPPPNGFRDAISAQGVAAQMSLVQSIYQALEYFYRAIDLPAFREPVYKTQFESAYGKEIRWDQNIALGTISAGWMQGNAFQTISRFADKTGNLQAKHIVSDVLPHVVSRWVIRASVRPDSVGSGIICPETVPCLDSQNQQIPFGPSWNFPLDAGTCETTNDWRCTFWTSGGDFILPALVLSVDLAWKIASQLKTMDLGTIVKNAVSHSGLPLTVGDRADPDHAPTYPIPSPPVGKFMLPTGTLLQSPFGKHPAMPTIMPPVMPMASTPPRMVPPSVSLGLGSTLRDNLLSSNSSLPPIQPPTLNNSGTSNTVPSTPPMDSSTSGSPPSTSGASDTSNASGTSSTDSTTPSTPPSSSPNTPGTTSSPSASGTSDTTSAQPGVSTPSPVSESVSDNTFLWLGLAATAVGGYFWYQRQKEREKGI